MFTLGGFWSGLSIIAAQRVGANDLDGFGSTVRAGFAVPLAGAVLCAGLSIPLAYPIVHAMVGPLASAHASATYLIMRCLSLVPIAFSGTLITALGAAGNRKLGVIVLALINIIHIPLLAVLALGWMTHHPFGIVGAGVSSLLSESVAAVYAVLYTLRRPLYRVFDEWRISMRLALECARLGLPESVFLFAVAAPDTFIVAMLAPLGATVVAGFRALNVVSDLTFVIPSPLQSATQTVVGQRIGAGDIAGARWFFQRARVFSFWVTTAAGAVVAALAWPLSYAFTLNAPAASLAALPLALHMTTLPLKGYALVSLAPIRAAGDTRFSMIVGLASAALVVPLAFLCIKVLHIGLYGVPVAWIAAWSARVAITVVKLRGDSWTRRGVITVR
jgi:Na+-driven multidrug efflux pump